jgi:hypothetical protein
MSVERPRLRRRNVLTGQPEERLALRLLKRGFRPAAVEKTLGLSDGHACTLRKLAQATGMRFPVLAQTHTAISRAEYWECCEAAGIAPDPNFEVRSKGLAVAERDGEPWPHQLTYPRPWAPRTLEAGLQAERIRAAAAKLRHVPASMAGGGERHFGRECAESLADLIAYAPGPRYVDDPRALRREPRIFPEIVSRSSPFSSSAAMCAEVAA